MENKLYIQYIKDNLKLIDSNNFTDFYDNLLMGDRGGVTSLLLEAGINPLLYMNIVPAGYLAYQKDIEYIDIPSNIEIIDSYAFHNCTSLKRIIIPEGVKKLGYCAFKSCDSLVDVTIPKSIDTIGEYVFMLSLNLKSINYNGTKFQWSIINKGNYWNGYTKIKTIHCIDGDIKL